MYSPSGDEVYIETHKVEKGEAIILAQKLMGSIEKQDSVDSLKVIGSDSCNKNMGQYGGVAACVEAELGRPLQRVLCLKHRIELVWHCFFKTVDGPTTLEGPIGKKICNNLFYLEDIVQFRPVKPKRKFPKLSREVVKKMSADQQ